MKNYSARFGTGDPRTYTGLAPTFIFFVNLATGATVSPPSISEQYAGTGIYTWQWGTTTPIGFLLDAATTSPGTAGRYVTGQLDPADRADEYGNTMIAIGNSGIALGMTGVALGMTGVAIGTTGIALGMTGVALGTTSVALGTTAVALGQTAVALGTSTIAFGQTLFAIGTTSAALGLTMSFLLGAPVAGGYGSTSADPTTLFGFLQRAQEFWEGDNVYTKATGILQFFSRGQTTLLRSKTITDGSATTTKTGL